MQPVLIVDDDPAIRKMVADTLEDEGFEISTAANGVEALRCIGVEEPAMVLLDLQMPVMSGGELLSTLHAAHIPVPVVLMTAGARADIEAQRYGANGYLAKPFDLTTLVNVVERFTARAA